MAVGVAVRVGVARMSTTIRTMPGMAIQAAMMSVATTVVATAEVVEMAAAGVMVAGVVEVGAATERGGGPESLSFR